MRRAWCAFALLILSAGLGHCTAQAPSTDADNAATPPAQAPTAPAPPLSDATPVLAVWPTAEEMVITGAFSAAVFTVVAATPLGLPVISALGSLALLTAPVGTSIEILAVAHATEAAFVAATSTSTAFLLGSRYVGAEFTAAQRQNYPHHHPALPSPTDTEELRRRCDDAEAQADSLRQSADEAAVRLEQATRQSAAQEHDFDAERARLRTHVAQAEARAAELEATSARLEGLLEKRRVEAADAERAIAEGRGEWQATTATLHAESAELREELRQQREAVVAERALREEAERSRDAAQAEAAAYHASLDAASVQQETLARSLRDAEEHRAVLERRLISPYSLEGRGGDGVVWGAVAGAAAVLLLLSVVAALRRWRQAGGEAGEKDAALPAAAAPAVLPQPAVADPRVDELMAMVRATRDSVAALTEGRTNGLPRDTARDGWGELWDERQPLQTLMPNEPRKSGKAVSLGELLTQKLDTVMVKVDKVDGTVVLLDERATAEVASAKGRHTALAESVTRLTETHTGAVSGIDSLSQQMGVLHAAAKRQAADSTAQPSVSQQVGSLVQAVEALSNRQAAAEERARDTAPQFASIEGKLAALLEAVAGREEVLAGVRDCVREEAAQVLQGDLQRVHRSVEGQREEVAGVAAAVEGNGVAIAAMQQAMGGTAEGAGTVWQAVGALLAKAGESEANSAAIIQKLSSVEQALADDSNKQADEAVLQAVAGVREELLTKVGDSEAKTDAIIDKLESVEKRLAGDSTDGEVLQALLAKTTESASTSATIVEKLEAVEKSLADDSNKQTDEAVLQAVAGVREELLAKAGDSEATSATIIETLSNMSSLNATPADGDASVLQALLTKASESEATSTTIIEKLEAVEKTLADDSNKQTDEAVLQAVAGVRDELLTKVGAIAEGLETVEASVKTEPSGLLEALLAKASEGESTTVALTEKLSSVEKTLADDSNKQADEAVLQAVADVREELLVKASESEAKSAAIIEKLAAVEKTLADVSHKQTDEAVLQAVADVREELLTKVGESETTSAVIVNTLSSLENTLAEASTDAVLQAVAGVRDEVAKLHTSADAVCDSVREVHTSKGDEQVACENGHMADSEPAEGTLVRLLSAVQELQQTVCTKDVAVSQFNTLQETMQSVISQEAVMQAVAGVRDELLTKVGDNEAKTAAIIEGLETVEASVKTETSGLLEALLAKASEGESTTAALTEKLSSVEKTLADESNKQADEAVLQAVADVREELLTKVGDSEAKTDAIIDKLESVEKRLAGDSTDGEVLQALLAKTTESASTSATIVEKLEAVEKALADDSNKQTDEAVLQAVAGVRDELLTKVGDKEGKTDAIMEKLVTVEATLCDESSKQTDEAVLQAVADVREELLTKVDESEKVSAAIVGKLSSLESTLADASIDAVLQAVAGVREELLTKAGNNEAKTAAIIEGLETVEASVKTETSGLLEALLAKASEGESTTVALTEKLSSVEKTLADDSNKQADEAVLQAVASLREELLTKVGDSEAKTDAIIDKLESVETTLADEATKEKTLADDSNKQTDEAVLQAVAGVREELLAKASESEAKSAAIIEKLEAVEKTLADDSNKQTDEAVLQAVAGVRDELLTKVGDNEAKTDAIIDKLVTVEKTLADDSNKQTDEAVLQAVAGVREELLAKAGDSEATSATIIETLSNMSSLNATPADGDASVLQALLTKASESEATSTTIIEKLEAVEKTLADDSNKQTDEAVLQAVAGVRDELLTKVGDNEAKTDAIIDKLATVEKTLADDSNKQTDEAVLQAVAGVRDELLTKVGDNEAKTAAIIEGLETVEASVKTETSGLLEALLAKASEGESTTAALTEKLSSVEKTLADDSNKQTDEAVLQAVADVREELLAKASESEAKSAAIIEKLATVEKTLADDSNKQTDEAVLQAVAGVRDELLTKVGDNEAKTAAIIEGLETVEASVKTETSGLLEALLAKASEGESTTAALTEKLSSVEKTLADDSTKQTDEAVLQAVADVREELLVKASESEAKSAAIIEKLEAVEKTLADDSNKQTDEAVLEAVAGVREELLAKVGDSEAKTDAIIDKLESVETTLTDDSSKQTDEAVLQAVSDVREELLAKAGANEAMTAAIIDKLTTVEAAAHTDAAATQHHAALSNMLASLEAHTTLATETPPPALLQKIDAVSEALATLASTLSNVHHGVQEISSESVKQRDIPDVITERMSRQMQQLLEAAVDGEGDRETALNTTVQLIHEELRSIRTLGNSVEATTGELADLRAVVSDLSQASQQTVTQTEVRELVDTISQGEAATTEHLQRLEALISSLQEALAERDVDEAIAQLTAKVSDMQAAAVPDTKLTHIQEVLESVHLSVSRDDLDMTLSTRDGLKPSEPRRSIDNKEHALSQGSLPSIAKDNDYSSPAPVPRLADSFTLRTGLRNESIISPRGTPELRTPVHQSQHEKVPALQLPKAVNTDLIAKFQEIRASQVLEFIDQIKYNGEVELLQAYYVKLFVFYRLADNRRTTSQWRVKSVQERRENQEERQQMFDKVEEVGRQVTELRDAVNTLLASGQRGRANGEGQWDPKPQVVPPCTPPLPSRTSIASAAQPESKDRTTPAANTNTFLGKLNECDAFEETTPVHRSLAQAMGPPATAKPRRSRASSTCSAVSTSTEAWLTSISALDASSLLEVFQHIAGQKKWFDSSDLHNALESVRRVREFFMVSENSLKQAPMAHFSGNIMAKLRRQGMVDSSQKVSIDSFMKTFSTTSESARKSFFGSHQQSRRRSHSSPPRI